MLELLQSNRMSLLLETLSERLQQPDDPFEPALIVVQSQGIGQWLKVELAERLGIAANIDCLLPAELIWRLYQQVLPEALGQDLPSESPFSRNLLTWRLMELLPGSDETTIQQYLNGPGDPQLRGFQLSHAIASLYDQYLIYRPDWIYTWEETFFPAELKWQSDLWRQLIANPDLDKRLHRANLHKLFLDSLSSGCKNVVTRIPKQINLLGISSLPQMHLETLQAVASHQQVSIYFLNPCQHYWGDISSEKDIAKKSIRNMIGKETALELEDYLEVGNPLLSSTGQQGREFLELLLETDGVQSAELFDEIDADCALKLIQSDVLYLEFGGEFFDIDHPPTQRTKADNDNSIQIHSVHSRMREVEVLLDQLYGMIDEADGHLLGSDIIVMAPDISLYAPFIEAVFQDKLGYSITDRPVVDESAILGAFQKLLALPEMRLSATEVIDFLEVPAIARRLNLSDGDISRLQTWIRDSGIRFEIDGQTKRDNWQLGDDDYNTWRFGLDRLLLGLSMEPEAGLFENTAPMEVAPGDAELLGTLCDFLDRMDQHRKSLSEEQSAKSWQTLINQMLTDFIEPSRDDEIVIGYVADALQKLVDEHQTTTFNENLSPRLFRYWLERELQQPAQNRGFVSGRITFATLVPMRSIPYKVVCLLGMNDREFPREDKPLSFDLMSRQYRKGDRSRRNDDRYLFLEAIMSAQEKLYLSFVGRGQKDNKDKAPSELLSELIDYLERVYESFPIVEHPLQPFSQDYFRSDMRYLSYARHWFNALEGAGDTTLFTDVCINPFADGAENEVLRLEELSRFFRHPARHFLNLQLGVYFGEDQSSLKDSESFSLDGLERYQIADQALQCLLTNESIEAWSKHQRASGLMLPGELGTKQLDREIKLASAVAEELTHLNPATARNSSFELEIDGTVIGAELILRDGQYIAPRTGELRARQRLEAWINHLALCAAGQGQESLLIYRKGSGQNRKVVTESIQPVPKPQAKAELTRLFKLYHYGQTTPLKFLPEASKVFAESGSLDDVIKQFPSDQPGSEATDPYYNRAFNLPLDFDEEFSRIAVQIWEPLLITANKAN